MAQLDLFGGSVNKKSTPGKKPGVRRSIKKQPSVQDDDNYIPKRIIINSDGNVLEYVASAGSVHRYRYVVSNTKLDQVMTFNDDQLREFLVKNKSISICAFVKYKK